MSGVLCVLETGGDNEDPNESQPGPTSKTMVVLEDIVVSLANGRDSTKDRDRDREGGNNSERENNRVVERIIDKEAVDGVDEPTQARHCTSRVNATNLLEHGREEDTEGEWGPLCATLSIYEWDLVEKTIPSGKV